MNKKKYLTITEILAMGKLPVTRNELIRRAKIPLKEGGIRSYRKGNKGKLYFDPIELDFDLFGRK